MNPTEPLPVHRLGSVPYGTLVPVTYGPPPDHPRPPTSPTILVLVSGLTGVLGFLVGMFAGFGLAEPVAQPGPEPGMTIELSPEASGTPEASGFPQTSGTPQASVPPGTSTAPGEQPVPSATPYPTQTQPAGAAPTGGLPTGGSPAAGNRLLIVGTDIQPGTYRTTGPAPQQPACYWARLSSLDVSTSSVIAAGMPTGPATVTIEPTDKAFQTGGCADWVRV
ncbi:hypothetical protein [Thermoactinospora rubra]|uniref:hypothetical protein n=1 Tax=Thermoactinospora rubra TaxID=1088767 RepID=UPI000A11DD3C|nr:hypothetical protein [Thermoactinospora rubra]